MVTKEQVTEYSVHEFVAEASTLCLPVGQFPYSLETNMGNGSPFVIWTATRDYVIYRQWNGCITLRIFND